MLFSTKVFLLQTLKIKSLHLQTLRNFLCIFQTITLNTLNLNVRDTPTPKYIYEEFLGVQKILWSTPKSRRNFIYHFVVAFFYKVKSKHTYFHHGYFYFWLEECNICSFDCTVRSKWNQSLAQLWGKLLIFKRAFHKLWKLPQLYPPQNL